MGKIRIRLGNKKYNLFGKEYELQDGLGEVHDYIGFNAEGSHFPMDHWELSIIINFGAMQSGKSEYTKAICELGSNLYADTPFGFECYQTNDLIGTIDYLNREENIENRKKVIFLVFDDAMGDKAKGMNSLNTMGKENKEFEQILSMIRHKLANEDENLKPDPRCNYGFCCCIFSIQSLKRLSTFVRDNATLRIFKTAYDLLENEFCPEDYEFLKKITEQSDKHIYESRSIALAKSKNTSMKLYFPRSKFKIPVLIPPDSFETKYNELLENAERIYNPEMQSKVLHSYIWKWGKNNGINLNPNLIKEIEYQVLFDANFGGTPKPQVKKIDERQQQIDEIMEMRNEGISIRKIANIKKMKPSTVFNLEREGKVRQKKLKNQTFSQNDVMIQQMIENANNNELTIAEYISTLSKMGKLKVENSHDAKMLQIAMEVAEEQVNT